MANTSADACDGCDSVGDCVICMARIIDDGYQIPQNEQPVGCVCNVSIHKKCFEQLRKSTCGAHCPYCRRPYPHPPIRSNSHVTQVRADDYDNHDNHDRVRPNPQVVLPGVAMALRLFTVSTVLIGIGISMVAKQVEHRQLCQVEPFRCYVSWALAVSCVTAGWFVMLVGCYGFSVMVANRGRRVWWVVLMEIDGEEAILLA